MLHVRLVTRSRRTRGRILLSSASAVLLPLALAGCDGPAEEDKSEVEGASHAEVSLSGSLFEIDTDANLKVDDAAPSIDWASVSETRKGDQASGANDDSFGEGTKEDTAIPTVVSGSIPPNKSDLLNFGVYLENTGSRRFLHVFWHRVQEPSGTTNMDFEFNQSDMTSSNGVTPVRTAGDLLIQYDLAQGGTNPQLFLSRWVETGSKSQCEAANATPCWGTRVNLTTSGSATGSINSTSISAADADGLGAISPRTFGEATIDFDVIAPAGKCVGFGSAYLKSRSSDSFTAAVKDFISPTPTNLNNCATVIIRKVTVPTGLTDTFSFTPAMTTETATDGTTAFTLTDGGSKTFSKVFLGTDYTVTEATKTGFTLTGIDCSASTGIAMGDLQVDLAGRKVTFDLNANADVVDCTFTNTRNTGAIRVTKTRKHAADGAGSHAQAGVSFTVNGVTKQTDTNGQACFDGLQWGSYNVTETVPTGYVADDGTTKSVTVDNNATCADNPYGGETVTFTNTPLTDITVSVNSQVNGGTASTITCVKGQTQVGTVTTGSNGDGSLSLTNLVPETYVCTVVVDP